VGHPVCLLTIHSHIKHKTNYDAISLQFAVTFCTSCPPNGDKIYFIINKQFSYFNVLYFNIKPGLEQVIFPVTCFFSKALQPFGPWLRFSVF
jgi:hypothetical protein